MQIFFESWASLLRTFIIAILAYLLLIVVLRVSGKRTLSKMNAFDLVVTIALGSVLATVILNKNVPLVEGVLAFTTLIFLQFLISFLSFRSETVSAWVKSSPSLLVYKGNYLKSVMNKERINEDEILAVLRKKGITKLEEAGAVVLETDGSLTVMKTVELSSDVLKRIQKPSSV